MESPARRRATLALLMLLGGVVVVPSAATAGSGKPTLAGVRVASVAETTATVTASVDPNGLDTTYAGQYGATGYGTEIKPVDVGAGTSPVAITIELAGLSPGTTYRVLLSAENSDGMTSAPALSLRTRGSAPPTATTVTGNPPPTPPGGAPRFVQVHVAGTGAGSWLSGISCSAPGLCVAVGTRGSGSSMRPVLERWRGGRWQELSAGGAGGAGLFGISCASDTQCLAGGVTDQNTLLALLWNGESWERQTPPVPAASGITGLNAVSCRGVDDCWGVGYIHGATPQVEGLIEHWDAHGWTLRLLLGRGTALTGVACGARDDCWAAGNGGRDRALAEHWNGRTWMPARLPSIMGATGVTCTSPSSCWLATASGSGLLRLVGRRWHTVPLPLGAALEAISCSSTNDCFGSGYWQVTANRLAAFAGHWDGRRWSTARTVSDGPASLLAGIACPTSSLCLTVGSGGSDAHLTPLAERLAP